MSCFSLFGGAMGRYFLPILFVSLCSFPFTRSLYAKNDVPIISEQEFLERWQEFDRGGRVFPRWKMHTIKEELKARFDQIHQERWSVYFVNPESCQKPGGVGIYKERFQTPSNWKTWGSRYPYPGAFSYNLASPSYNSSIVVLDGKKFLALEAPTQENVSNFYDVLDRWGVTDLVRLTPATSNNRENCFPYWEGRVNINKKNGRSTIEISGRERNYFFTDCWADQEGEDPQRLLALVKAVMSNDEANQMIAVHCRAGVGRTGTFIAAYALVRDIEGQISLGVAIDDIKVSIDKIIWELSLQRPFMVARFSQYLTLYELVDSYVSTRE
jgi:hypothetical protein